MARQNFGFGGGANMQQLMRQAQKMQQAMTDAQEKLDAQEYEAQSGGGVVSVKVNGKRELLSLTIDPKVVDPDDVEMLQDLVMAAVNEALRKGEANREETMNKIWQRALEAAAAWAAWAVCSDARTNRTD